MPDINTHGLIVNFGRHKDALWTRVPVNYLKWILTEAKMADDIKDIARSELKRRGIRTPTVDISGHAIDRASLFLRRVWLEVRNPDEGIHSWLIRISEDALKDGLRSSEHPDAETIIHKGIKFIFTINGEWPVLKTIMPNHSTIKGENP